MKQRNDIQELRGISFLLVFIYHLKSIYMPGGFIGVDIFFAISGYIITKSINNLYHTKFFFISFYAKRIKRLYPSSFFCLLIFYFYHPSINKYSIDETKHYYDIIYCLLCLSNIHFHKVTESYFQNYKKSILLNYWSLSLEEQFYIIYPILYVYVYYQYTFFATLSIISYLYCILNTYEDNSSSYFFLSNRSWEFFIGCLINKKNLNNCIINKKIIVFTIILSSYFIGNNKVIKFPGYISLLPILLTSLILLQQNNILFNSNLLLFIGNISYTLYLFHYPIIQSSYTTLQIILYLIAISTIIYYLVELPFRRVVNVIFIYSSSILTTCIFLYCIIKSTKINAIKEKGKLSNSIYCRNTASCNFYSYIINVPFQNYVILIGDSHLSQYLKVISICLSKYNIHKMILFRLWTINFHKNYNQIIELLKDFKQLKLCIISFYVNYDTFYIKQNDFEIILKIFLNRIVNFTSGIIIIQDNPHRISENNTKCKQYLLPIINNKQITYLNTYNDICKSKAECIENFFSNTIYSDMHHIRNEYICKSEIIINSIELTINKYLNIRNKISNIPCSIIELRYKTEYNYIIIKKYNISYIKRRKNNKFGLAKLPKFYHY